MHRYSTLLFRIAAAALCVTNAAPASGEAVTVAAASSLAEAFADIARRFEQTHPGTNVRVSYGSSGALLQQIRAGAPVDVFAAADARSMDLAAAEGLLDSRMRHDFARNKLVVAVPADATELPSSLSALTTPRFRRLALGQPDSVPAGRYAREALKEKGLWETLSAKLVPAQNVRQAVDYVARGEVDAAFVYATDLTTQPGRVRLALDVPLNSPIRYPIAPLADSREPAIARDFVHFVLSEDGQAVLRRHGFLAP